MPKRMTCLLSPGSHTNHGQFIYFKLRCRSCLATVVCFLTLLDKVGFYRNGMNGSILQGRTIIY